MLIIRFAERVAGYLVEDKSAIIYIRYSARKESLTFLLTEIFGES